MKFEISKEQKGTLTRIESEASYKQSDFFREKGYGNFEEFPEKEIKPRNIIFPCGYFLPEDVSKHGSKIYREHLILGMKKAGFDHDQIIEYIKFRTGRTS